MTWNVEGIKRNIFALVDILLDKRPVIVALNEIQIFKTDFK